MENLADLSQRLVSLATFLKIPKDKINTYQKAGWHLIDEKYYYEAALVFRGMIELEPLNLDYYRGYIIAACQTDELYALREVLEQLFAIIEGKEECFSFYIELLAIYSSLLYQSNEKSEALHIAEYILENAADDCQWIETFRKDCFKARKVLKAIAPKVRSEDDEILLEGVLIEAWQKVEAKESNWAEAFDYSESELMEMYDMGTALFDGGDLEKALSVFDGLIALDENVPLFVFAYAQCKKELGELDSAQKMYTKAVRMAREIDEADAFRADALYQRALIWIEKNEIKKAMKSLKEILQLDIEKIGSELNSKVRRLYKSLKK